MSIPTIDYNKVLLIEAVALCIVENAKINNIYICTHCDNIINIDEKINIMQQIYIHVLTHVYDYGFCGIYSCEFCGMDHSSDNLLNEHISSIHPEYQIINIIEQKEDEYEQKDDNVIYNCPVCNNEYKTQLLLGIHFMDMHNNYDTLNKLDEIKKNGFPGFDVLSKIGMCNFILNANNGTCMICYMQYNGVIHNNTDEHIGIVNKYNKYRKFCDDTQLLHNKNIYIKRYPIKLYCCKATLCSCCIKNHIEMMNGDPICPFCRKSHIQYDKKYIIYDERPKSKRILL